MATYNITLLPLYLIEDWSLITFVLSESRKTKKGKRNKETRLSLLVLSLSLKLNHDISNSSHWLIFSLTPLFWSYFEAVIRDFDLINNIKLAIFSHHKQKLNSNQLPFKYRRYWLFSREFYILIVINYC